LNFHLPSSFTYSFFPYSTRNNCSSFSLSWNGHMAQTIPSAFCCFAVWIHIGQYPQAALINVENSGGGFDSLVKKMAGICEKLYNSFLPFIKTTITYLYRDIGALRPKDLLSPRLANVQGNNNMPFVIFLSLLCPLLSGSWLPIPLVSYFDLPIMYINGYV